MNRKILAVALAALCLAATASLFIAGVWTGDVRWSQTGVIGLFLCVPSTVLAIGVVSA